MISFNFQLIYSLGVLQKGLKIDPSDCIQMSETWTPPGALRRAPGPHANLRSARFARYAPTFLAPPLQKNFRGPCKAW